MPAKGQFKPQRIVICPCGNKKSVRETNTQTKYCSFDCYIKFRIEYDHKAINFRHTEEMKQHLSNVHKRPITEVQRKAYDLAKLRPRTNAELASAQNKIGSKMVFSNPEERGQRISESRSGKGYAGNDNFRKGRNHEDFARILCPIGFQREFVVKYGLGRGEQFYLDFALPEIKFCIEIDGAEHKNSKEWDFLRDKILTIKGWYILRVPTL